jgi:predicted nucleic acid-binding protein
LLLKLFLDANVLYVSLLRDLLLRMAVEGVCHVHWSADVQQEWKTHLVAAGYSEAVITRTQLRMNMAFPQAQIEGYQGLIPQLILPDPADRHVLAAAIHAAAGVLVTFNLKDFPVHTLSQFGVKPLHPDILLTQLMKQAPEGCQLALKTLVASLKSPPMMPGDIATALEKLQMPQSAEQIRVQFSD